eukprot:8925870-Alexandrium_andersonii.AAC.1
MRLGNGGGGAPAGHQRAEEFGGEAPAGHQRPIGRSHGTAMGTDCACISMWEVGRRGNQALHGAPDDLALPSAP